MADKLKLLQIGAWRVSLAGDKRDAASPQITWRILPFFLPQIRLIHGYTFTSKCRPARIPSACVYASSVSPVRRLNPSYYRRLQVWCCRVSRFNSVRESSFKLFHYYCRSVCHVVACHPPHAHLMSRRVQPYCDAWVFGPLCRPCSTFCLGNLTCKSDTFPSVAEKTDISFSLWCMESCVSPRDMRHVTGAAWLFFSSLLFFKWIHCLFFQAGTVYIVLNKPNMAVWGSGSY